MSNLIRITNEGDGTLLFIDEQTDTSIRLEKSQADDTQIIAVLFRFVFGISVQTKHTLSDLMLIFANEFKNMVFKDAEELWTLEEIMGPRSNEQSDLTEEDS